MMEIQKENTRLGIKLLEKEQQIKDLNSKKGSRNHSRLKSRATSQKRGVKSPQSNQLSPLKRKGSAADISDNGLPK